MSERVKWSRDSFGAYYRRGRILARVCKPPGANHFDWYVHGAGWSARNKNGHISEQLAKHACAKFLRLIGDAHAPEA